MNRHALGGIRPITILHIISGDVWAGAEAQVFNTILSLRKRQELRLICIVFNSGILKDKLDHLGVEVLVIDEVRSSSGILLIKLCRAIRAIMPDVIHVHRVKEHVMGSVINLMVRKRIPFVRTIHGLSAAPRGASWFKFFKSSIAIAIDRLALKYLTTVVVVVSKDLGHAIRKLAVRADIQQIYNSIDLQGYVEVVNKEAIRNQYSANGNFWIGTAARLIDVKNIPMLIRAGTYLAERRIPFKISIFGEGPLKTELQDLVLRLKLSGQVELHGFQLDMVPVIKSLDVFVLSSFHEGIPIALLEAMASNTPVVCTSVGGMREIIEDGVNGLLVPVDDSRSLAEAIFRLYEGADYAKSIARNARTTIEGNLSAESTAQQLGAIYRRIAAC